MRYGVRWLRIDSQRFIDNRRKAGVLGLFAAMWRLFCLTDSLMGAEIAFWLSFYGKAGFPADCYA